MAEQLLTHSRAACFRTCPRKHYWRYEQRLRPAETSAPLKIGSMFHRAMEAEFKGEDIHAVMADISDDPYDLAMVAAMYDGYKRRWKDSPVEVIAAEQQFEIPLVNPETGGQTPIWMMAGVIDRIARLPNGQTALWEFKTTSRDFSPGADYWVRLHLDQQLSMYIIAARSLGYDIQTVVYDVTRRPSLRPLKATPEESRKYTKNGTLYATQRDCDETPEEFAGRIAENIAKRPDHHFARIEIARMEQDIQDCMAELWQQQLTIREAQRSGRWFKNPESCFSNYGTCEYLGLCQNGSKESLVQVDDIHPEISRVKEEQNAEPITT